MFSFRLCPQHTFVIMTSEELNISLRNVGIVSAFQQFLQQLPLLASLVGEIIQIETLIFVSVQSEYDCVLM